MSVNIEDSISSYFRADIVKADAFSLMEILIGKEYVCLQRGTLFTPQIIQFLRNTLLLLSLYLMSYYILWISSKLFLVSSFWIQRKTKARQHQGAIFPEEWTCWDERRAEACSKVGTLMSSHSHTSCKHTHTELLLSTTTSFYPAEAAKLLSSQCLFPSLATLHGKIGLNYVICIGNMPLAKGQTWHRKKGRKLCVSPVI